jgi:hypothetical protein
LDDDEDDDDDDDNIDDNDDNEEEDDDHDDDDEDNDDTEVEALYILLKCPLLCIDNDLIEPLTNACSLNNMGTSTSSALLFSSLSKKSYK